MFIRAKKISGKEYAYLVRTRWDKRSKKVKQKVSKYLGSIRRLDKVKEIDFFEYHGLDKESYIREVSMKELVRDLVEFELYRHGFTKDDKGIMSDGVIQVNPDNLRKVLALNEGYMHNHTLKEIENYHTIIETEDSRMPYRFAALFVNAGIDIDKEMFIALYERFFSGYLD